MKIKHIVICLAVILVLIGCSVGISTDQASNAPTATPEVSGETHSTPSAACVSFSAGDDDPVSTVTPSPTPSAQPTITPTPSPTATPKATQGQKPSSTQKPKSTPKPAATPTPAPASTPEPKATAVPVNPPVHTPAPTPKPSTGRTICNTCGEVITGKVAEHGTEHLLKGENFSYRVE